MVEMLQRYYKLTILGTMGLVVKYQQQKKKRKANAEIFQKNSKSPILGPFWALFAQIWAQINFPGETCSFSF